MDYNELKKRIAGMNYTQFNEMTLNSMLILTDVFKEPLVRCIIARAPKHQQKYLLSVVESFFERTCSGPYPEYFKELQFDIDCGIPITVSDNETTPAPASTPKDTANIDSQVSAKTKQQQEQEKKLQKELAERDATIEELQERIADYESRFDPKDIKGRKVCAMTGKQHVILFLSVLAEHDRLPNARTNLDCMLSFIAARNQSTMHEYLKDAVSENECEKLAKKFDTDCPFIAKLIRQLPDKLKKDISKKNSAKALKKVKE